MHCPLCNADNDDNATTCVVCDLLLTDKLFDSEGRPKRSFKKLYLFVFALLTVLFILPWALRKETFTLPLQVKKSQLVYNTAIDSYTNNQNHWSDAKDHIVSQVLGLKSRTLFQRESSYHENIPFEVLLAYLLEDLEWDTSNVTISPIYNPKHNASFLLSKKEKDRWPLAPCISVLINIDKDGDGMFRTSFGSLKRGSDALPISLTTTLFKDEIDKLSNLQMFAEGLKGFYAEAKKNAPDPSKVPVTFSWEQSAFLASPDTPSLPVR